MFPAGAIFVDIPFLRPDRIALPVVGTDRAAARHTLFHKGLHVARPDVPDQPHADPPNARPIDLRANDHHAARLFPEIRYPPQRGRVHISARTLHPNADLPDTVAELADFWATAPDRLTLELTESALIDPAAPDVLARLHNMGGKVSIDDFGTGYSSLAYLQNLPVDQGRPGVGDVLAVGHSRRA